MSTTVGLAVATLATISPASAVVPTFPDNLVVFPDRDFVSVEGYADHRGETATVEVTRPGSGVIGSAEAVVSGADVAFEVNHPGGVCWGAGTSLEVTPDIRVGDVVSITFPGGSSQVTTVSTAAVSEDLTQDGTTFTVKGTLGPDVDTTRIEQRIVDPDLVGVIGRRDVRAVPGPVVPSPRGGYSSGLTFPTSSTFVATYEFATRAAADTAAAADLGERTMSWQEEDADGNRQGLTIAEFGETGGPGFGGCPAGPTDRPSPAGSASVARSADRTSAVVSWTAVTSPPGADPVTGYEVSAIGPADAAGDRPVVGTRLGAGATRTTLGGLDPAADYTFEVRSMAGNRLSVPFGTAGAVDTTVPTLTLSPDPGDGRTPVQASSVSATSNGQVFYTTDGSPAVSGDAPADNAQLYTGPIRISAPTDVNVAAFDQVGNLVLASGRYTPVTVGLPDAPTGLAAGAATQTSVPLTWDAGPASVTGYQVTVYDADGARLTAQPSATAAPRQTVTGLQPGTTYRFTVAAKNAAGTGPDSATVSATTAAPTDRITITSARWKPDDFRILGTGSVVGSQVQAYRANADGSMGAAIAGASARVVPAAPPGVGAYTIRLRDGHAPATNPGRVLVTSSGGGVAGPFTVPNG
jgi:hypothetical protein